MVRTDMKAISFTELSVHCMSSNSLCVLGQDMALSGTFSSLMPQMTTKVPSGSTMTSAHESLVLRGSISPVSQLTEALTGPGFSSWPAQARDIPSQGSRLPGARKGGAGDGSYLKPHRGCCCPTNPHTRGRSWGHPMKSGKPGQ